MTASDIDLRKATIAVYDSILSGVHDKEIQNVFRPFSKMIPSILSATVPATVRKKREKQFSVRRLKNDVPQNDWCLYHKIHECLAISCTFEGLRDKNISDIQRKPATEIYDAVNCQV